MRKWLRVGMRVKRYLLALALGITLTSLAIAMALATLYRNVAFPGYSTDIVRAITLQFIPHPLREMVVALLGFGVIGGSIYLSQPLAPHPPARRADGAYRRYPL